MIKDDEIRVKLYDELKARREQLGLLKGGKKPGDLV